jgi:2-C-methyl-D-erythritol 4-phosphate cytidylyltransferase/2-C-methyl-D-erythritol 2,4-cyclodiphosphate synthase
MLAITNRSSVSSRCAALIVAAGRGDRFGGQLPKQYLDLAGSPVIRRTVLRLRDHPAIDEVVVVIDPSHRAFFDAALAGLAIAPPVAGGESRQESIRRGLEALAAGNPPELVLIHDAVRPLLSPALIERVVAALTDAEAVLPVLPVVDTLKRVAGGRVVGGQARDGLVRAQTPQGFRFAVILDAHRRLAGAELTDDAALASEVGIPVRTVAGEERNLKITTPDDLAEAERRLVAGPRWRTGVGFDVHRLVPGRRLVLGGIEIPHELGLAGHSDADVVAHAVTDALLGSVAAGDIGEHFPPSDPRWRDVDSAVFLVRAAELIASAGGRIENIDVMLMCERPRIAPYRAAMRARLAELLDLPVERVSIKATTTERLGFTGREEGIAAQAVVSVALPG